MKKVLTSALPKSGQLTPAKYGERKTGFQKDITMAGTKGTTPHPNIQPPPSKQGAQKREKGESRKEMIPAKTLVALIKHQG